MHHDDLPALAERLRGEGAPVVQVRCVPTRHGDQPGILVDKEFFPAWELDSWTTRATLDDIKANRRPEWESVEPAFWATTLATQQIASYSTQNRPYLAVDLDGRQAHFLTESELTTENLNHAIALFDLRQPDKTSVAHREFIQERLLADGRKEAVKRLASVIDTVVFIP
jgi:hypothetical protein